VKYKSEKNKLLGLLGDDTYNLFKTYKVFIAGGCITSLFCNKEINDVDVYFRSKVDMLLCLAEVFGGAIAEEDGASDDVPYADISAFSLICLNVTDKSITFEDKGTNTKIQFICFDYFNNEQEIFDSFDFTVCMGAFSFETEEFVLHEDFLKHNSQRYLKFNTGTAFPIMSTLRVNKYIEKGYTISKTEYLRVVMQCMTLNLTTWDEATAHIGGMYGWDMNDIFNQEEEFSLASVIQQLGEIADKDVPKYSDVNRSSFEAVVKTIAPEVYLIKGEQPEEPPFREGYFYKTVDKDWTPSCYKNGSVTKYEVGSIVDGGRMGIFVNVDPHTPYTQGPYWVELELQQGGHASSNYYLCGDKQTQLFGPVKVTNTFIFGDRNIDDVKQLVLKYVKEHSK
jgi:hypothetical protein